MASNLANTSCIVAKMAPRERSAFLFEQDTEIASFRLRTARDVA